MGFIPAYLQAPENSAAVHIPESVTAKAICFMIRRRFGNFIWRSQR